MRPRLALALCLASLAVLGAGGCGGTDDGTPAACLGGAGAYLTALGDAPGAVRLGGTPISDCLAENQAAGDLAAVGTAAVGAATRLNAAAREAPQGSAAALRLGYLLGAAARGEAETEGIHADLLRRLTAAARYSPGGEPLSATFRRAYRRGYAAGRADG